MTNLYASYEQEIESRIIRERHIVRISLNETKHSIIQSLSNVPDYAIVSVINGSDEISNSEDWPVHGEIWFTHERDE